MRRAGRRGTGIALIRKAIGRAAYGRGGGKFWRHVVIAGDVGEGAGRPKRADDSTSAQQYNFKLDNNEKDIKLEKQVEYPTGTSESYAHRRLRKDRPDIHASVVEQLREQRFYCCSRSWHGRPPASSPASFRPMPA
jgi:hypothetical protein